MKDLDATPKPPRQGQEYTDNTTGLTYFYNEVAEEAEWLPEEVATGYLDNPSWNPDGDDHPEPEPELMPTDELWGLFMLLDDAEHRSDPLCEECRHELIRRGEL